MRKARHCSSSPTILYGEIGESWWLFAVLFLAPDLSFLGYLAGPRIGAIVYNAAHTLVAPMRSRIAGFLCPPSRRSRWP